MDEDEVDETSYFRMINFRANRVGLEINYQDRTEIVNFCDNWPSWRIKARIELVNITYSVVSLGLRQPSYISIMISTTSTIHDLKVLIAQQIFEAGYYPYIRVYATQNGPALDADSILSSDVYFFEDTATAIRLG